MSEHLGEYLPDTRFENRLAQEGIHASFHCLLLEIIVLISCQAADIWLVTLLLVDVPSYGLCSLCTVALGHGIVHHDQIIARRFAQIELFDHLLGLEAITGGVHLDLELFEQRNNGKHIVIVVVDD